MAPALGILLPDRVGIAKAPEGPKAKAEAAFSSTSPDWQGQCAWPAG